MDDIRKSFSKLKKDFKHRVGGKKQAPDGTGANTAGEGVCSSASLLQPDLRIVVGGHDGGGSRISTDVSRVPSSLDLDIQGAGGSGPGQEIKRASSPLSVTPIPPKQEPNSTRTLLPGCCI